MDFYDFLHGPDSVSVGSLLQNLLGERIKLEKMQKCAVNIDITPCVCKQDAQGQHSLLTEKRKTPNMPLLFMSFLKTEVDFLFSYEPYDYGPS